ncbi:2-succinyl-5-enolpyruvyl-6-hydroxy-3-cyclohexene-1-carboxylic-acid synthase [Magnetospirillum molischianum]|uniref:2-succinyl-5-enolpyruvyl-6-hydroxy-3-cyclohexene-1-carboxylate synthase n=1 Tax=Magnetospirillum molischianum DSM 120 TaxID=1150626 RepID=H8FXS1_MAGML|nr:2-succinyl-5-enolpyruvyl-6-hydroxy-3-cyclohexene-1-carboxylic-acid synthase [Magnetospirillum molischianum]CCG43159.1 2-succinyl-5-enolpyruvyl-6-hydroxy-3-cyclohexene-1-carboxylate synthase [Magnetospirillum molischianum DSM 120]
MMNVGDINAAWAAALIDGLAGAGVCRAVISPGSRSTPLALACLRHSGIVSRVLLDERVAAFYALGLARAEEKPVVLVCTSGSAAANWYPAVAEADAARVPLILLTADRPPELQDCGANQTFDQRTLFVPQVRAVHTLPPAEPARDWLAALTARAVSQSLWPLAGPVQINVPFREPLLATDPAPPQSSSLPPLVLQPRLMLPQDSVEILARRVEGRRGVILAGAEHVPAEPLIRLANALNWPIIADPLSGLRFGAHDRKRVMTRGDLFLRGDFPPAEIVLRFGAFPVSKAIGQWQSRAIERIVVSEDSRWPDPGRNAAMMIHADPGLLADSLAAVVTKAVPVEWLDSWYAAEQRSAVAADRLAVPEAALFRAAIAALPEGSLLFVANSMAVRDLDDFSGSSDKRLTVLCNRGLSGIDGNLSTFFGAVASGRFPAALALVGDLTFLHDLSGLAAGQGMSATICLFDNGGGGIFDYLPQTALPEFVPGWLTPQRADFAAATAIWGHRYCPTRPNDVVPALTDALATSGVTVLHLAIDRTGSAARHRAVWAASSSFEETSA